MKRLVWPVLAFSWAACGPPDRPEGYEPVNLFEEGAGERVFDDLAFDTLWTYGKGDTVLGSATRIEAFGGSACRFREPSACLALGGGEVGTGGLLAAARGRMGDWHGQRYRRAERE